MDVSQLLNGGEDLQWFDLVGTQPLARIQLKFLKPKEFDDIINQSKRFGSRRATEFDLDDRAMEELLDQMVVDWDNIKNGEEELPCTKENKLKLDQNWMLFRKTWRDIMMDHLEGRIMQNQAEVGN